MPPKSAADVAEADDTPPEDEDVDEVLDEEQAVTATATRPASATALARPVTARFISVDLHTRTSARQAGAWNTQLAL
jgi:hypothetical protein